MPALTDSRSRRLLAAEPKRRLLATSEDKYKYSEIDGYLPLTTNRPRTNEQRYREIELSKQDYDSDESEDLPSGSAGVPLDLGNGKLVCACNRDSECKCGIGGARLANDSGCVFLDTKLLAAVQTLPVRVLFASYPTLTDTDPPH